MPWRGSYPPLRGRRRRGTYSRQLMGRSPSQTITCQSFGVTLRVSVQGTGLIGDVHSILPPGWQPSNAATALTFAISETARHLYDVTVAGAPSLHGVSRDLALGALDAQIRAAISVNAPEHIFVHAGVVACDGRALLIPGTSFSGKTTLVAALAAAGATYFSDEYAVLESDGRVHPYPRPLSIRGANGRRSHDKPARELGADTGREPARIAGILVTHYRPGARWDPAPLSAGEAALHLLANTVPARARPEQALQTIARAVAPMKFAVRSDRGEAGAVIGPILEMLGA
jgi:hypothetical protein